MNRRAVKMAMTTEQPYVTRTDPATGNSVGMERLERPCRIERYPFLCLDYDTRELCITETVRVPLESVSYYEFLEMTDADREWRASVMPKPPKQTTKPAGNATGRRRANAA